MGEAVVREDARRRDGHRATMPYLGAIDGIRALAVTAVLLYHGDVAWIPGGFLGVEVFFVVSGYLITALLLREHRETGRIRLGHFLRRRARRLLPALAIYLVGSYAIASVLARDVLDEFREGLLAAVFYVYNWFAIGSEISYAEGFGRKSFLHHLWSLAIEEQFYLIWPLVLWGGLALFGRRISFVLTLAMIGGSTALMWLLYEPFSDPIRVYYGTDTRAAGLLVGAAMAFIWRPWEWTSAASPGWRRNTVRSLSTVAGVCAVVGLGWTMTEFDLSLPFAEPLFRGGFLAVSILTAAVIAAAAVPGTALSRVLALAPLRWVGTRSYGLYLWHWPIYQVTRPRIDVDLGLWPVLVLRLLITAVLAEASYRLVERPIREGRFLRRPTGVRWRPRAVLVAAIGAPAMMAVTILGLSALQVDQHDGTDARELVAAASVEPAPPKTLPTTVPEPTASSTESASTPEDSSPDPSAQPQPTPPTAPMSELTPEGPRSPEQVTFIGDSVMEGAAPELLAMVDVGDIDTEVGRHWFEAPELLDSLDQEGDLGDAVVIHLGNNSPISDELFDEVMAELVEVELVVVVNVRVPVRWEKSVNKKLAAGVKRWDNAVLVDWHDRSDTKPRFFANDGVHIGERGRRAYVRIIAQTLGVDPVTDVVDPTAADSEPATDRGEAEVATS